MRNPHRGLLDVAAWAFAAAAFAGTSLRPWVGDELLVTRYTGYVMPWLLLGLVPGMAWGVLTRRRALAAMCGVTAAIIIALHAGPVRSHGVGSAHLGPRLTVMSSNTWWENRDATRIVSAISRHDPDLLLLQEIRSDVFGNVVEALRVRDGGDTLYSAYESAVQQGVISRFRVQSSRTIEYLAKTQKVIVDMPQGPIAVFNVHPLRTRGWRRRYDELAELLHKEVLREHRPVLLAGDFNAPELSDSYRLVAAHLRNAHREAGAGLGFSYPSSAVRVLGLFPLPALVRIDHIFFSDEFVAVRAGTSGDSGGSDHYPVYAELALREAQGSRPAVSRQSSLQDTRRPSGSSSSSAD